MSFTPHRLVYLPIFQPTFHFISSHLTCSVVRLEEKITRIPYEGWISPGGEIRVSPSPHSLSGKDGGTPQSHDILTAHRLAPSGSSHPVLSLSLLKIDRVRFDICLICVLHHIIMYAKESGKSEAREIIPGCRWKDGQMDVECGVTSLRLPMEVCEGVMIGAQRM